jgi:hypothetical protein
MCNGVACSKATGLTHCNVEWVNACVILPKTRLTLSGFSPFQALRRSQMHAQISLVAQPARCTSPTLRKARLHLDACGERLAPRRANEGYTAEPPAPARLGGLAYHRRPGSTTHRTSPDASTRSLRMPTEQGHSSPPPMRSSAM